MTARTRPLAIAGVSLLLGASGVFAFASPASAVLYPVVDEASLVAAINSANGSVGVPDVISIGATTIVLTADLPNFTDDVQLVGAGSGATTILATGFDGIGFFGAVGDRIDVTISGLTVSDSLSDGIQADETTLIINDVHVISCDSSGIHASNSDITITGSEFSENAIGVNIDNPGNTVSISSTVSNDNFTLDGVFVSTSAGGSTTLSGISSDSNDGSGVFLTATDPGTTVTATGLTTTGSESDSGVYVLNFAGASVDISGVTSTGNQFSGVYLYADAATIELSDVLTTDNITDGVGIDSSAGGLVQVSDVSAEDNGSYGVRAAGDASEIELSDITATRSGDAGVWLDGVAASQVSLASSTVSANDNLGLRVTGDASTVAVSTTSIVNNDMLLTGSPLAAVRIHSNTNLAVSLTGVTVSGNDRDGEAIDAALGTGSSFALVNSTVSGNSGDISGVIISATGAAVVATAEVSHATITQNTSTAPGFSAGLMTNDVTTSVSNSIIAGGVGGDDFQVGDNFAPVQVVTVDYSLVQTANAAGDARLAAGTGNIVGTPALLGPLANNGGPTQTHLPIAGSPVVNAGEPAIVGAPATDQRGLARISQGRIDIGSVEIQVAALAATGVDAASLVPIAGSLLLLGALVLLASRRRTRRA